MTSGLETALVELIVVLLIATTIGVALARVAKIPYTIALLFVGFGASILGFPRSIGLTQDLILLVVLPALLFQGGSNVDLERLRANLLPVALLAGPGLLLSILLLGVLGQYAFGYPLVVALLFAAMILPTDAVSVVAVFDEVGAPERLSTVIESESLLNDGVGVVVFTAVLAVVVESYRRGLPASEFTSAGELATTVGIGIVAATIGGLLVGAVAGYLTYRAMVAVGDPMMAVTLTIVLAYGSYLLADGIGVSGAIAAVVAGLFIGDRGETDRLEPRTRITVATTWGFVAFLINTILFVLIGLETPLEAFVDNVGLVFVAFALVFLTRAVVVYPLTTLANRWLTDSITRSSQHVIVWSGLHASIPIALVLGLPAELPGGLTEELRVLVFGVAALSLVLQGLSIEPLLDRLRIVRRSPEEEAFRVLTVRLLGVDAALESASELHDRELLPGELYEEVRDEYTREKRRLEAALSQLLERYPAVRRHRERTGRRRVLESEKSAIMDAINGGLVDGDNADRVLDAVDARLERVNAGESFTAGSEVGAGREFVELVDRQYDLDLELTDPSQADGFAEDSTDRNR